MSREIKLGSLFDGAGGFPLAGVLAGVTPVWASEIEPFPIRVTTKRFPNMKHLGDVNKLNGGDLEPVDIITFGSPCQDLSVAGKREGLSGERSGLFMEAIRVIKEMRVSTNNLYPRFIVWENVIGAFSSNDGEDFRVVIEEIAKIKDSSARIPFPRFKGGEGLNCRGKSWQKALALPGVLMTRNTGEYPRDAVESTLSEILMDRVPEKYNLSPTACTGILRRAEEAGKKLPELLRVTLEHQINQ